MTAWEEFEHFHKNAPPGIVKPMVEKFIDVLDSWIADIDSMWHDEVVDPETREKKRIEKITYMREKDTLILLIHPEKEEEKPTEESSGVSG
jgi:hypothetical protein